MKEFWLILALNHFYLVSIIIQRYVYLGNFKEHLKLFEKKKERI